MMQATSLIILAALAAQTDPLLSGIEAFSKGRYPEAERLLRDAVGAGGDARARTFLDLTLAATSRCAEAEPGLRKASTSAPDDVARLASLALAQCFMASSRTDEAAAVVQALRSKYPADADVLYQAARLHMRAWNDTIYQLYQKAPASFRVNQISGEILETQGQFAEAVAEYRKAIEKNPQALSLHFRVGRALLMSSHEPQILDAALREFHAELVLNPADSVAHYQVAQILLVQQKTGEAAGSLQRALELNPDFTEVLIALGKLRADAKDFNSAIAMLQRAVATRPGSEAARYSLMMAYRNAGRMDDARREKAELDKLQSAPDGEFTDFLKRLGEKPTGK